MAQKKFQKERKHKINSEVRFPQVRLIGSGESIVLSSYEASKLAESQGKDLILINENQNPPIVKIEDYNKFIYDMEKAEKEKKKNTIKSEIREIQLSCEIALNDLMTKARKAKEFINQGDKVRCVLQLRGRQKSMSQRGESVMYKFYELMQDDGQYEDQPKLEGDKWSMTIKPKKK
jgi:translation initiation factor IF-3